MWKKAENRFAIYSLVFLCLYIFIFVNAIMTDITSSIKLESPFGIDFAVYYTTGKMVTAGNIENIYNVPVHHAALEGLLQREIPFLLSWVYPPTFLLVILPFSILPYYVGLAFWQITTFLLALWAVYLLIPKHKNLAFLFCGFPGVLMNFRWGQNGFLNTSLLAFGLYFLERSPVFSGLMFGLLAYKPQIAFFPIIVLLMNKKWRVLMWTIFFAVLSSLVSAIIFGFDIWAIFLRSFSNSTTALLDTFWEKVAAIEPTFYSVFRLAGISRNTSYLLQGIVMILEFTIVFWICRKTERISLRGSSLVLGILISSPYFVQYDLVILSIPLVLLSYDLLEHGYRRHELALLFLLWILPLVNWPLVAFTGIQISPFVLVVVLAMVCMRVINDKRSADFQKQRQLVEMREIRL